MWQLILVLLFAAVPVYGQTRSRQLRLVEELRVGGIDGPQALTSVRRLTVSPNGKALYVMQQADRQIRVYDALTGKLIRSIGRRGGGPGEFDILWSIGWKGDTLFAYDAGQLRVSLFSPEGIHLRTERIPTPVIPETKRSIYPVAFASDGNLVAEPGIHALDVTNGDVSSVPWVLVSPDGKMLRRIATQDPRKMFSRASVGSAVAFIRQPMAHGAYFAVEPAGAAMILVQQPTGKQDAGNFNVSRISSDGRKIYARTYHYVPRSVPPRVREDIYREQTKVISKITTTSRARALARDLVVIPSVMPPVSGLVAGADGSAWLRREETGGVYVAWTVLDPKGNVRAQVQAPSGANILYVRDNTVWAVVNDEIDVPFVVRYRVESGR